MNAVLSKKGAIVLPKALLHSMNLKPGDDFEIYEEDEGVITMRRVWPNSGPSLYELLRSCPEPLDSPPRQRDPIPPAIDFDAE